jgi:DNA-binding MarR family transcriptional regulator
VTTEPGSGAEDLEALSSRLRFSVARLARLLRHQDGGTLGATASSALATVSRVGAPTLGELAASEHVAAPTITKVVGKLEDAGLVRREVDPSDRRVSRVLLTPEGQRHLEENRSRRTAWLVGQLRGLPADDVARLAAAVDVLEALASPTTAGAR